MKSLRSNPWVILAVLLTGFFMILLDTTIVSIAIPSIIDQLHAGLDSILWVINGYILAYAVLLIVAGRLGDMYGQRNLFAGGMALFIASSAVCGITQDPTQLIIARVFQGTGGALLTPQTLAIMTIIFPSERRGTAFGIWGAVAGVATIVGPTLGGLLVTDESWRWVFYINVPIGIAALIATFLIVPDFRPGRRHRLDLIGVGLVSAGLFAITFALIQGQSYNWGTIWAFVTIPEVIALGVIILVGFVFWERRRREPLIPLSLFRDRNFSIMNWVGAITSVGLFGLFLVFTIYLQSVLGMTALAAGLTFAPMSVLGLIVSPIAGRLTDRVEGKYILMLGLFLFAVAIWLVASTAGPTTTWQDLVLPLAIMGIGQGCVFAPQATIAMRHITPRMSGAASGVLNTTRQLGAVIGSASVGALLQNQLVGDLHTQALAASTQLPSQLRSQFVNGFTQFANSGLQVGRSLDISGQVPPNLPAQIRDQLIALIHLVFSRAFIDSMQYTMWLPIVFLIIGIFSCLFVESRSRAAERARLLEEEAGKQEESASSRAA